MGEGDRKPTLSVLVASSGRSSLNAAAQSIGGQLTAGDELLVDVNDDAPWGHAARNRLMPRARGEYLMFLDDDDRYVEWAFDTVRAALTETPHRIHVFRMRYADGRELWQSEEVACGNVSTQMFIVPNIPDALGEWGDRYEGDFDFLSRTTVLQADEPVWHRDVIALYRPD
jgi:hypothetical protein